MLGRVALLVSVPNFIERVRSGARAAKEVGGSAVRWRGYPLSLDLRVCGVVSGSPSASKREQVRKRELS